MIAALAFALALQNSTPADPVEFGAAELRKALVEKGMPNLMTTQTILRAGPKREGEYRIRFLPDAIDVAAWNDDVGAMYGLLEAAERVRNGGKDAWKQPVVTGKPYLAERGWNMFLPLPWDYDKNFIDNDPAALTDPARWFFMNDDYCRTLFDQMA
ncbi:MAG TPA: hypothetical protein PLX06_05860, partial [Fimbriimonadaceae bacterium]|nr:hypothetical protein [Fimbriimonadaceae bacterium]